MDSLPDEIIIIIMTIDVGAGLCPGMRLVYAAQRYRTIALGHGGPHIARYTMLPVRAHEYYTPEYYIDYYRAYLMRPVTIREHTIVWAKLATFLGGGVQRGTVYIPFGQQCVRSTDRIKLELTTISPTDMHMIPALQIYSASMCVWVLNYSCTEGCSDGRIRIHSAHQWVDHIDEIYKIFGSVLREVVDPGADVCYRCRIGGCGIYYC